MSQYNPIERRVASLLNRHPGIKQRVKNAYQRLNYYAYADRGFTYSVQNGVSISQIGPTDSTADAERERFVGYYDVCPWSASMDRFVCHEVADSSVEIVSYERGSREVLATSTAWNHQQGSRTQWLPDRNQILFNDERDGNPFARAVTLDGEEIDRYDRPVQAVSPTGDAFISLEYGRLDRNRPDYGYDLPGGNELADPTSDGLWRVDMRTGSDELLYPLQSFIETTNADAPPEHHYLNHVLYAPSGDRFVFLHRWRGDDGRKSRLYVADGEGAPELLMDDEVVSHYCWLTDETLLVWGRTAEHGDGYHVVDVETGDLRYVDALDGYGDGHPSLSPNGRYVVTDTYPNRERQRRLLLYDRERETVSEIGRFLEPLRYTGRTRCDLHPRWSPDGRAVSIDSTHAGTRNTYVLDVSEIVD